MTVNKIWYDVHPPHDNNTEEMEDWIADQFINGDFDVWFEKRKSFFFRCEEDAMAFKLRWT